MFLKISSQFLLRQPYVHSKIRLLSSVPLSFVKLGERQNDEDCPLLIFHGLFGNKNNWRSIGKQIANRTKNSVYSFDLRNHGESPHVDGHESTLQAMADDIGHFIDSNNLQCANILGHSLGGRVAAQFAFDSPTKVNKLILADITPLKKLPKIEFLTDKKKENVFEALKNLVTQVPPNTELSKARPLIASELLKIVHDKFIVDFFLLNLYKNGDRIQWRFNTDALRILVENRLIHEINVKQPFYGPSLIIYGKDSPYVQESAIEEIEEMLPSVQLIGIPDAGHYLHIEKTKEFIDHIVQFLN